MSTLPSLNTHATPGAAVTPLAPGAWRLEVPAGPGGVYRLAQLDDYTRLPRNRFGWRPPARLRLRGRASHPQIPGTWGFGFWNDPFSLSLGLGGAARRFPALPDCAWFFIASPPNYLSFRDDLPAQGALAATFRAAPVPAGLLALASLLLPGMAWRPAARRLRRLLARLAPQDARLLRQDVCAWHTYSLEWRRERVCMHVDDQLVLETDISPGGPLGLVIWIDNQYAALPPDGRLDYGTLPSTRPAWIEIADLQVDSPA